MDLTVFGYSREFIYRYNFAFYPFYGLGNKGPFNWLYIGTVPIFYHNIIGPGPNVNTETRSYGPGISGFMGFQYVIKDKFSIGADLMIAYFKELKKNVMGNHMYFIPVWGLKFGFIIR
jgi:hypothetical protein